MGAKISKSYSSYKSQPKDFVNFLLNDPHKSTFGILKILKLKFLTIFVFPFREQGGAWENATFQNATPTNRRRQFQTCPEFSSPWSSQHHVGDF